MDFVGLYLKAVENNFICFLGKEGNVLFNDALNTFYLRLYDVRHIVRVPHR